MFTESLQEYESTRRVYDTLQQINTARTEATTTYDTDMKIVTVLRNEAETKYQEAITEFREQEEQIQRAYDEKIRDLNAQETQLSSSSSSLPLLSSQSLFSDKLT